MLNGKSCAERNAADECFLFPQKSSSSRSTNKQYRKRKGLIPLHNENSGFLTLD